jgi:hypothetical protein
VTKLPDDPSNGTYSVTDKPQSPELKGERPALERFSNLPPRREPDNPRLYLLNVMAPLNHEPMCNSDDGEDLDECDCWKSVMTEAINKAWGGNS